MGNYCVNCGGPTRSTDTPVFSEPSAVEREAIDAASGETPPRTTVLNEATAGTPALRKNADGEVVGGLPMGSARRSLVIETRVVMIAFLVPGVASAVIILSEHVAGVDNIAQFATFVKHQPLANMLLGILAYLPVAAIVPMALYLLSRTGQDRTTLGLVLPQVKRDILPAIGLDAAAFATEFALAIPVAAFLAAHKTLVNSLVTAHVPAYYIVWGLIISATTAITEEVLVNGYLITRLGQLGWTPRSALILSLILRTSYHVYYGFGFIFTIPLGFYVTRSFQKHHKLTRPILAHFLYDAILFTIAVLH